MKVFLSWSGSTSLKAAKLTYEWLPTVMQSCEPFLSDEDVRKGDRWSIEIAKALDEVQHGLFFITKENLGAPWLLFEAGAISKSLERGKVSPILLDMKKSEYPSGPLSQFQMSEFTKTEFLSVLSSVNNNSERPLNAQILERTFEGMWPGYENQMRQIILEENSPPQEFNIQKEISQISFYFRELREFLESDSVIRKSDFLDLYGVMISEGKRDRVMRARELANELNATLFSVKDLKLKFEVDASFENRKHLMELEQKIAHAEHLSTKIVRTLDGSRLVV